MVELRGQLSWFPLFGSKTDRSVLCQGVRVEYRFIREHRDLGGVSPEAYELTSKQGLAVSTAPREVHSAHCGSSGPSPEPLKCALATDAETR